MQRRAIRLSEIVLPAYYEFWKTKKTYVVAKGSRGSGKSKHAALWVIYHMMRFSQANTLVVRKVERTLRDSAYSDLKWAIERLGVSHLWKATTSPLEITYIPTGQKILFRGLDDGYKITSISVPTGVLCWVWMEEFYEITKEEDFDIIDESIRGQMPAGLWKRVMCTFNPWSDRHFAKKRFFDTKADNILAMTTTYKDNPYLSEDDIRLFEEMKIRNPRRYQVAGLGNWGIVDGLVFENWEERKFTLEDIGEVQTISGLDFGYTNDPSAFFIGFVNRQRKEIYIWDEMYELRLTNSMIARRITEMGYRKELITADCAEPKSITELRDEGLRIQPARKGKDSIRNGIQLIQDYRIIVHPRCANFLTELSCYTWKKDRFGKTLNEPIDDYNHLMDAFRYGMERIHGDAFSFD